jgi:hypothetical protein
VVLTVWKRIGWRDTPPHGDLVREFKALRDFAQRLRNVAIFSAVVLLIGRMPGIVTKHVRMRPHFPGWRSHREEG